MTFSFAQISKIKELRSLFPAKWTTPLLLVHLAGNKTRLCFSERTFRQL